MFESFVYTEDGLIAWRRGTGDNVEITYIRVDEKRTGSGTRLVRDMVYQLMSRPPFHTVYGFTRSTNFVAHDFYRSLGFTLSEVHGVYRDGKAIVFSVEYKELYNKIVEIFKSNGEK